MATYGRTNSRIPFTGWTPTLSVTTGAASQGASSGAIQFNGLTQNDLPLSSIFNRQANRAQRMLLYTLIGAAAGSTATSTYRRIEGISALSDPFALGGLVGTEVINYVNRATTAADVTAFKALLDRRPKPATYAADVSRNGGGGKAGY